LPFLLPLILATTLVAACGSGNAATTRSSSAPLSSSSPALATSPTHPKTTAKPKPLGKPVHVSLAISDGEVRGVGMPIIAWFNRAPTDATAFVKATTVTVNGRPVNGAWYFERTAHEGAALEAHYRTPTYWPAHASIKLNLPVKGRSAGPGLYYDDNLTLAMSTGPANIATVNAASLQLTLTSDGREYGPFPVSLGAPDTPTARGIKVIMEKGASICMSGPGYSECGIKYTQRLTYGGEYLHSAPWNIRNLGRVSTSNGCTNLSPADALELYNILRIGDVVQYPNASGPRMELGSGYGDWNLRWSTWLSGGALQTQ
jgi:lipoprotein-anchoring transpeptidase ErfK/SrfK